MNKKLKYNENEEKINTRRIKRENNMLGANSYSQVLHCTVNMFLEAKKTGETE